MKSIPWLLVLCAVSMFALGCGGDKPAPTDDTGTPAVEVEGGTEEVTEEGTEEVVEEETVEEEGAVVEEETVVEEEAAPTE